MQYLQNKSAIKNRRSIRLQDYDYSQGGYYFVTICTENRELYFAHKDIHQMINDVWQELKNKFKNIDLGEYVIMPNHLHGIVVIWDDEIVGADLRVRPNSGQTHRSAPTLGQIMQWFKTMTTNYYIHGVKNRNWPRFDGRLWQRNYWEHIIRNDFALNRIRQYIKNNPLNWQNDRNNPNNFYAQSLFSRTN